MKKISIFKSLFSFFILCLLFMLLWSSISLENELKIITQDLNTIKQKINDLPGKFERTQVILQPEKQKKALASQVDPSLPNLLTSDPFYQNTLPQLLGKDFVPQGIRREAMLAKPATLHPFNGFAQVSHFLGMCSVNVAKGAFGIYETMTPDMAIKIEKRLINGDEHHFEYWVHLRDSVYWQPLNPKNFNDDFPLAAHFFASHQVTAHDFRFFYDAIMNPHVTESKASSLKTYYDDIESFQVIDDLTFVVRWKRQNLEENGVQVQKIKYSAQQLTGALQPLARFVYQYFSDGKKIVEEEEENSYRTNSIWAQNFMEHWAKNVIVSCGPWIFDEMDEDKIIFRRNPDHYDPYQVLVEKIVYEFKESPDAIWQNFKSRKTDLCLLTPQQMLEYQNFLKSSEYAKQKETGGEIYELSYLDQAYYYLGWNQHRPPFNNKKIRQALTMAIDRDRIIHQNLNGMAVPITGPFSFFSPAYDLSIEPIPYQPDSARELLEEEGWVDLDGDGIRDKLINNHIVAFRFHMVYYAKSHASRAIAEYVQSELKEIGIDCRLHGLDLPDLSRAFDDKNFDAIFMGWKCGAPPEDPKQLWHSIGAEMKGSSNAIGFQDSQADAIIEALLYEDNAPKRIALYHDFHRIIHDQSPYTFLYCPKIKLLYREHVKNIFIPRERKDLIPSADIPEPDLRAIYLAK